ESGRAPDLLYRREQTRRQCRDRLPPHSTPLPDRPAGRSPPEPSAAPTLLHEHSRRVLSSSLTIRSLLITVSTARGKGKARNSAGPGERQITRPSIGYPAKFAIVRRAPGKTSAW